MSNLKIGWIGTGVMGKSMCKHLLRNGHNLSVFNRTEEKANELVHLGAKMSNPQNMAKTCDVIFMMLGYPRDVESMTLGPKGILRDMKPGSYLVDHTTSSPELASEIFKQAKVNDIVSYDAPVSGGDIGARDGKLIVMAGGDKGNFHTVESIMKSYSSKVMFMGEAGKGQHTKMANQVIIASTMIGVIEGLIYGKKAGLNMDDLVQLLGSGGAGSFSWNAYAPRILRRDFEPGFYVEHFVKDMEIALQECERMNINLKGLELAHSFYKMMVDEGMGRKGTQGLYLVLEKLNNLH
jgi:3-hydroxyisobutyrate dehydrogenase